MEKIYVPCCISTPFYKDASSNSHSYQSWPAWKVAARADFAGCSGQRPWCKTCKERNKLCIYDTGATNVKRQETDVQLTIKSTPPTLPFPGPFQDTTLFHELLTLFTTRWDGNVESVTTGVDASAKSQNSVFVIDYQHGLSQILRMTVDSLVIRSLPFAERLQASITLSRFDKVDDGRVADDFHQHVPYVAQRERTYSDDQRMRHPEIHDLGFNSHPFLALIVCRTKFFGDIDEKAHDKLLYDAVLIAGLGAKEFLSQNSWCAQKQAHGLPNLDELVRRTTYTLYGIKLGLLKVSQLHVCTQCMMVLAWHELTHGLLRRAATWWTIICEIILRIRAITDQGERSVEVHINGVDLDLIVGEELKNMHTIARLILVWLELYLGPFPTDTWLGCCARDLQASERTSSWILELDDRSGKISTTESYKREWTLLSNIERVIGGLTESYKFWKSNKGLTENRTLATTMQDDATWRVSSILSQSRLLNSGTGGAATSEHSSAAALISLTALLACFHGQHSPISISAQGVDNIVKVCSTITLQLRDAFGGSENTSGSVRSSGGHETGRCSACASYFIDTLDGNCIALTMIETIALTFELLLAHTDSDRVTIPADWSEEVNLSVGAQQTVTERLGNILGIISTIRECFDNILKQGRRPGQIIRMLDRMQEQIENLGIQPDVSFAFDVAFAQIEADPSLGENAKLQKKVGKHLKSYEMDHLHCSSIGISTTPSFEGRGQWLPASCQTSSLGQPITLDAAFPTPPSIHTNFTSQSKGSIAHGPGPISIWRHDCPGPANPQLLAGCNSGSSYARKDRFPIHEQASHAWREGNPTDTPPMLAPAPVSCEGVSVGSDHSSRNPAMTATMFDETMLQQMQTYSMDLGSSRSAQGGCHGRGGTTLRLEGLLPCVRIDSRLGHEAQMDPEQQAWGRSEATTSQTEVYQRSYDASTDVRSSKRARIEQQNPGWPHEQQMWAAQEDLSGTTGVIRVNEVLPSRLQSFRASANSAVEALASIQGIQPLTDEMSTGGAGSSLLMRGTREGEGRTSGVALSNLSLTTNQERGKEYYDDHENDTECREEEEDGEGN